MTDRRRAKQQAKRQAEREAHPRWAPIRQRLFAEPDAGASAAKGAIGERRLGASLDALSAPGTIEVLHDRRRPGTVANIDHLAVAASAVWVIDAKLHKGRIAKDMRGGLFSSRDILSVAGRDRTELADGVVKQMATVRSALDAAGHGDLPVHGALCFIDGDWSVLRRRPFAVQGVLVTWPKALRELLSQPGDIDSDRRQQISLALEAALPPAS
jgi:hypothetical protein